ncbi:MAG: gluconate 2-dehydrogenase subunit 3 family protein [Gemmatimonadales bacterium]
MHRREVVRLLAASAGIGWLEGLDVEELLRVGRRLHARAAGAQAWRALGAHAVRTVTVAAERIIPADDTPGATDAGVTAFIDHMLADWYEPAERDRLLRGLAELDDRARGLAERDFIELPEADQVAVLSAIDAEAGAGDHWFATLKFLTVWGYFTSEVAVRETLGEFPLPGRYDGCAPYQPLRRS